jgi:hypothetical protein
MQSISPPKTEGRYDGLWTGVSENKSYRTKKKS